MMFIRFLLSLLLLVSLHSSTLFVASLNISLLLHSVSHLPDYHHPPFLKEVLKEIAVKKRWDLGALRVSKLEKVRLGYSKRHEFLVRIGNKRDLVVEFSEQVDVWRKLEVEGQGSSLEELVSQVSSKAVLRPFLVNGPSVLIVDGVDDGLSLRLPMNTSFSGLRQIIVGEGITLKINGAQQIYFPLSSCNSSLSSVSYIKNKDRLHFWPLVQSFCLPLLPMHVVGSVYVTAFRRNISGSPIEKNFLAKEIVELKTPKCYTRTLYMKPLCSVDLGSRVVGLQRLLRSLLGDKMNQHRNHSLSYHKAKMQASTLVRFQLELDRNVGANDTQQGKLPEWRTKLTVKQVWFDIVATVELGKLEPVTVEQVRPFVSVDSTSWSYLFSNLSLTEFSTILVPSHPLTLDVKWWHKCCK